MTAINPDKLHQVAIAIGLPLGIVDAVGSAGPTPVGLICAALIALPSILKVAGEILDRLPTALAACRAAILGQPLPTPAAPPIAAALAAPPAPESPAP